MSTTAKTAALLAQVFPGARVARPEYLKWLYETSPFGEVIETNLDDEHGRAGHYALVPIVLSRDGVDHRAALSLNTAIHQRARGGGAFVRLASDALAEASRRGLECVVGVANANSTPGFVRRLGFELLGSLPAKVLIPTPGLRAGLRSGWASSEALLAGEIESLLLPPSSGEARRWTPETLAWRLAAPGTRYALHRSEELLAVSCVEERHGIRVAILMKVFSRSAVMPKGRRALVREVCRFHRAPCALHVGLNELVDFSGMALPGRLRDSPLNLIYRSLDEAVRPASIVRFEFLDFDAY